MRLQKLEIKGFKSFGDKVTINFDEGVTAVVGPNGCGKSNIVDAIRWVLGEQKTTVLRSDKMENVIFNGSENRKPLQMAEVSLSFENTQNVLPTEYSQVTITRKLFREGEGEYCLNGVPCRLKDITDLFLDTGIGPDSYAIIELKMVENLLNDKDNSRMQIFEEAAGISKYKIRKKATLRKLEGVEESLKQVDNILFEIEKTLKSYEKQAAQTERYNKLKTRLKELSLEHARFFLTDKNKLYQELQKQQTEFSDKQVALGTQSETAEAHSEKTKLILIEKEKTLKSCQQEFNQYTGLIVEKENDKKLKNERLKFLRSRDSALNEQIGNDKFSLAESTMRLESLDAGKTQETGIMLKMQSELDNTKSLYEQQSLLTTQLKEKLSKLQLDAKKLQTEVFSGIKDIDIKKIQIESFRQELEKNKIDSQTKNQELSAFDKALMKAEELKCSKESARALLLEKEENNLREIQSLEQKIETCKDEISRISRQMDAKENEFQLTKSMVENLEGFPESIKFLKKNAPWTHDAPLLSDILTCPEEYKLAIENYLEPYLNFYVLNNLGEAWQAVNLLNSAAKGKAHFFILEQLENFQPQIIYDFENAISAFQIVECEQKYRKLVEFLLDNVYIVIKEQEEPITETKSIFITQNGKFIKKQFSLSGGSIGLFEGKIIGRAKNLEKLKKEIKNLSQEEKQFKNELDDLQKTLKENKGFPLREALMQAGEELNLSQQDFASLKTKCEQHRAFLSNTSLRQEHIEQEIEKLSAEIIKNTPVVDNLQEKLKLLEAEISDSEIRFENENNLLSENSDEYNRQNLTFHQQQNKIGNIENEINFLKKALIDSSTRLQNNQLESKEVQAEINAIIEKELTGDEEMMAMYRQKEIMEKTTAQAEEEFYKVRGEIEANEKNIREIQRQKSHYSDLLQSIQNQLNELKLGLTSMKERLAIEFHQDIEELMQQAPSEETNFEELEKNIADLKRKIENMGIINPLALESFNEVKQRYDFLTNQKNDLITSQGTLMQTIGEIEIVAKEAFLNALTKIKENFVKVFRTLFSEEDQCDIIITDPLNPLDSDIEIIAKPKGKRPLTINQLSTGEKTITAIALLFSIYLLKPAPFCVLDEVDAPLDDNNTEKFNNIIREFSKDSQFVLITHNKRTMEKADIIYGITMVEKGVSRVVPVDLRAMVEN